MIFYLPNLFCRNTKKGYMVNFLNDVSIKFEWVPFTIGRWQGEAKIIDLILCIIKLY